MVPACHLAPTRQWAFALDADVVALPFCCHWLWFQWLPGAARGCCGCQELLELLALLRGTLSHTTGCHGMLPRAGAFFLPGATWIMPILEPGCWLAAGCGLNFLGTGGRISSISLSNWRSLLRRSLSTWRSTCCAVAWRSLSNSTRARSMALEVSEACSIRARARTNSRLGSAADAALHIV